MVIIIKINGVLGKPIFRKTDSDVVFKNDVVFKKARRMADSRQSVTNRDKDSY